MSPQERKQRQIEFQRGRADLRRHRGGGRGHQPPVLPPDDQLRHAVEPDAARAAHGPHPPHRAEARRLRLQLRRDEHDRGHDRRAAAREARARSRRRSATGSSTSSASCSSSTRSTSRSCCARRPTTRRTSTTYLDEIERIDPERLKEYEKATGIALAKSSVDLAKVRGEDWRSQERRLMPEFVEGFFSRAARRPGCSSTFAPTACGVPSTSRQVFRADGSRAVQRLGRPDTRYPKFTFRKEQARESKHLDSELDVAGPPALRRGRRGAQRQGRGTRGRASRRFLDPFSPRPYRLHFYEVEVEGGTVDGRLRAGERDAGHGRRGRRRRARARARRTSSTTSRPATDERGRGRLDEDASIACASG